MNNNARVGFGTFPRALGAALQWRLLLLWIVAMALPTAIVALPMSHALGALLDHSVHSSDLARQFHALAMGDAIVSITRYNTGISGVELIGLIVTLLLSPLLTGMVVSAARAPRHASFGELMHGGIGEYWRMLRLLLWALVPFAIAVALGAAAMGVARKHADAAVLQSSADMGNHIAMIVLIVLLVLAHAMVESGRAQFAADPALRSATRAFGRGISMLLRRPLATLGMYLGTSIIGYVLVLLVGMLRIRTDAVGVWGFIAALLLTQLIVVILAWQRTARIFALAAVAVVMPRRRRRAAMGDLAPA